MLPYGLTRGLSVPHLTSPRTKVSTQKCAQLQYQTHKNLKLYNPIRKKFIETPEHDYVTWKALKGDSSDNIPGFKGVGNKTASKLAGSPELLEEF